MKKLLYTVMCCCALASCTNLDSERYDAINPDFFPTNEKDAEALVVGGVYAPFRSAEYSGVFSTAHSFQVIGDMSTDIAVCCWVNDSWIPLTTHNWTPNHSYTTLNYTDYAKYLGTMTLTLDRISNVEMSDEKKALLMAETHLGRGWLAFLLYDFYGPIPIPTLEDLKNPLDEVIEPRATQEEMTNFIETELTESLKGLPTRTTQFGRFDKGLAYTILMKYYMHEKNWAKAEECGRELLKAEYGYGLMDRYADMKGTRKLSLLVRKKEVQIFSCGMTMLYRETTRLRMLLSRNGMVIKSLGLSTVLLRKVMTVCLFWLANM